MTTATNHTSKRSDPHTTAQHERCADLCLECYRVCTQTLQYCLQEGGAHVERAHVRTMQDCIAICATSADFLLRESPLHSYTCKACAEICRACGEECAEMNDDMMRRCADACMKCYESCSKMAAD